jgi:hypothetical protein
MHFERVGQFQVWFSSFVFVISHFYYIYTLPVLQKNRNSDGPYLPESSFVVVLGGPKGTPYLVNMTLSNEDPV